MTTRYGQFDASFQAAGGIDGIRHLVVDFYAIMDTLPEAAVIRKMHPQDLDQSIDKLARFLSGWLGGPRLYQEKYGSVSIPGVHLHLKIAEAERLAWLKCMELAIARQNYTPEFADYLLTQLNVPAMRVEQVCAKRQAEHG